MARASWKKHTLNFRRPSGTSRGVLHQKNSWFLVWKEEGFRYPALGECSIIEGLSPDPLDQMEGKLSEVCRWLNGELPTQPDLTSFPSIAFGLEMLLLDRKRQGNKEIYPSAFSEGKQKIHINGLIWMGEPDFMKAQVRAKVEEGFRCIKLKIGALDFQQELDMLRWIRTEFGAEKLELRVDANGAFSTDHALQKLETLSAFDLHSIEQPIAPKQWEEMALLCEQSPIPIALDEELIGVKRQDRSTLLDAIQPQYIILKPSLVGGHKASESWINLSEEKGIGWWITSALESNVGLNAIAQYTSTKHVDLPQGLGTGGLYDNNIESPLYIQAEFLHYDPLRSWNLSPLLNE